MNRIMGVLFGLLGSSASAAELYTLIPATGIAQAGRWQKGFPAYDEVVGYSALGHLFFRSKASNDYAVFHPFKAAAKSYGEFADVEAFRRDVLEDPGFQDYVLRAEHVAVIHKRLGARARDEVYIPEPYPFLGGSEAPDTYSKGNVWVFVNILGDMVHLDADLDEAPNGDEAPQTRSAGND